MERYIIDYSAKNGLGHPAISLFLTGCDKPIKCKNCHNWELQEESKEKYSLQEIKENIDKNIQEFLQFHQSLHVTLLGGEPLAEYNRKISLEISKYVKTKYKKSTITIYSWRTIDNIKNEKLKPYLKYIDYGVLGAYNEDLHTEDYLPSSTNQYIYDFKHDRIIKPIKLKRG